MCSRSFHAPNKLVDVYIYLQGDQSKRTGGYGTAPPRTMEESLEALATSLQSGLTINTASMAQSLPPSDQVQSFMFGPGSSPLSSSIPTYASVLTRGALSPTRRTRRQSTESSGGESLASLSELMAKQQVSNATSLPIVLLAYACTRARCIASESTITESFVLSMELLSLNM